MSNNKQKTAVEWLFGQIPGACKSSKGAHDALEQAKEMEKQQIINAFWNGDNTDCTSEQNIEEFAEQYYNETFGGGEQ